MKNDSREKHVDNLQAKDLATEPSMRDLIVTVSYFVGILALGAAVYWFFF